MQKCLCLISALISHFINKKKSRESTFKYHAERLCGHLNFGLEPPIPENCHDMCTSPYSPLAIFALTKMRLDLILFFTFIFFIHMAYILEYGIYEFVLLITFQRYISLIYFMLCKGIRNDRCFQLL